MLTVTRQGLVASAAVTAVDQEAIKDVRPLMTRKLAWSCRAAGRLAAIRPEFTRLWHPLNICQTGSQEFRSARLTPRSSPAIR